MYTSGTMWFSLAQFRDNVLLATNIPSARAQPPCRKSVTCGHKYVNWKCCVTVLMRGQ